MARAILVTAVTTAGGASDSPVEIHGVRSYSAQAGGVKHLSLRDHPASRSQATFQNSASPCPGYSNRTVRIRHISPKNSRRSFAFSDSFAMALGFKRIDAHEHAQQKLRIAEHLAKHLPPSLPLPATAPRRPSQRSTALQTRRWAQQQQQQSLPANERGAPTHTGSHLRTSTTFSPPMHASDAAPGAPSLCCRPARLTTATLISRPPLFAAGSVLTSSCCRASRSSWMQGSQRTVDVAQLARSMQHHWRMQRSGACCF